MPKWSKRLLKIVVSAGLVAVVLLYVDFGNTLSILATVRVELLAVAALLLLTQTGISAAKWRLILGAENTHVNFLTLFHIYLCGQFISLFLPSSIGGDVYRVAALKREIGNFAQSTSSILFDRLSGVYALVIVAITGGSWFLDPVITAALGAGLLVVPIAAVLAARSPLQRYLDNHANGVLTFVGKIFRAQARYIRSRQIWGIMALSLTFQGMIVVINFVYSTALNLSIEITQLWAVVPIVYLTDVVPVSINGIGVRDSMFVYLFGLLGHPAESGFALAILILAMRYVVGLIGGVLLLRSIWTEERRPAQPQ